MLEYGMGLMLTGNLCCDYPVGCLGIQFNPG